jgi:hypothetical protein
MKPEILIKELENNAGRGILITLRRVLRKVIGKIGKT